MSEENLNIPANTEETKTRKTIRLRPLITPAKGTDISAGAPVAAPKADSGETITRKTIRLRPLAPQVPPVQPKVENKGTDDRTVRITRPSLVAPTPATVAPKSEEKTVRMTKVEPTPAAADDDRTVKLKRPAAAPTIPAVKLTASAAVPPPVKPTAPAAATKPTISLAMPDKATDFSDEEPETRRFNLVIGIAALLVIGVALLIISVHYLSLDHGVEIESYIPGLPVAK